jgi:hypothetical protein
VNDTLGEGVPVVARGAKTPLVVKITACHLLSKFCQNYKSLLNIFGVVVEWSVLLLRIGEVP